jgi:hypothetical protein
MVLIVMWTNYDLGFPLEASHIHLEYNSSLDNNTLGLQFLALIEKSLCLFSCANVVLSLLVYDYYKCVIDPKRSFNDCG